MAPECRVLLDRVQLLAWPRQWQQLPRLNGFRVIRDGFVRRQTSIATYARCRQYGALVSDTKIYWQHQPRATWLAPWKVTLIGDDAVGLSRSHIEEVVRHSDRYQLLMLESAFDFTPDRGIDAAFVERHAIFGKSCCIKNAPGLILGTRRSAKRVHCYFKPEVNAFRVELQLNTRLLRSNHIVTANDLHRLARVLFPKHMQFVDLAWQPLRLHLERRFGNKRADHIFSEARARASSVHEVLGYLRGIGVPNTHRFLRVMRVNKKVRTAFNHWMTKFMESNDTK